MLVTASYSSTPLYRLQSRNLASSAEKTPVDSVAKIAKSASATGQEFTPEQLKQLAELKARDREVRNHEQAHLSVAGSAAASGMHFTYVTGPDGQRYATGGEVSIDLSEIPGDPKATLRKAETIRRAAMAPANPSGQDRSVAAKAKAMANKALADLLQQPNASGQLLDIKA